MSGIWKLLRFATRHSLRDLWRSRTRTLFALVCVATGVAAVVALRSLAFMVGDELTTNLAQMNRGDIRIYASSGVPELVEVSGRRMPIFTQETVDLIRAWAADHDVEVTMGRMSGSAQVRPLVDGAADTAQAALILYVEPDKYPFYDTIHLEAPANLTFSEALSDGDAAAAVARAVLPKLSGITAALAAPASALDGAPWTLYPAYLAAEPRPLVISGGLAEVLGLHVGDLVRLGASEVLFKVAGIADSQAETLLTSPQTAFIDYLYAPITDLPLMGEKALPDQIFLKVPLGRDIAAVEASLIERLQTYSGPDTDVEKELNRATVPELAKQNAETANVIDDMILVMGLSSLLIGGIGIVNTMLVVVSRRTLEIAVLKTLGLKGYRVTILFLVEALLMGLIGSLIGIVVGVVLSYLIRGIGEEAFGILLEWRLYPEAMFSGLFLGIVMTGLFGFLPTLIAGQVRPAVVLRPNEAQMPAAGLVQTLITLVGMITILGLLVDAIVEGALDYGPVYMIAGGGALVGLFAGVIIANTRLGKPIPAYYVFRLARRYERLENRLTGAAGALTGWPVRWGGSRHERGRQAITAGLRGLRQAILLYGSLAIGAALASGILLIASEIWLPFGIGDVKPANDITGAWSRGDWSWIGAWVVLVLAIGLLIRWKTRALVGVIALSSLGVSLGGMIGLAAGTALERLIGGSAAWGALAEISTGVVLVEGALALLGVVYVGYWLLIWLIGRLPVVVMMGIVSAMLMSLALGLAAGAALIGVGALVVLVLVAALGWVTLRLRFWERLGALGALGVEGPSSERVQGIRRTARAARGTSVVMLSVAALGGGWLLVDVGGSGLWWGGALVGAIVFAGLWRYLKRGYTVDGRLILREMGGRRSRVASTLLGLSVGIAGLSVVTLTTGAVSRLLEIQLGQSAEGNLLIVGWTPEQGQAVADVLDQTEGVQSYAQFRSYNGILLTINGTVVEPLHSRNVSEQDDPSENTNFERVEAGISTAFSERLSLENLPEYDMKEGRALQPGDEGQHRLMLRDSFFVEEFGIHAGDRLQFKFENDPGEADDVYLQLRVVGIISRQSKQTGLESAGNLFVVPPGTLSGAGVKVLNVVTVAMVDESNPAYMRRAKVAVSDVPGVLALELSAITQLLNNLINQLKAIPTLVAWLALMAGTAIIANTVALATQERRRQIGVMKAVGLKGWRVLAMLMVENGLIGLFAGLIGAGVGFLITVILVLASQNPDELKNTIEFATMGRLVLMSIGVAIGAALLSAWSAAAEKPMNVLRYE